MAVADGSIFTNFWRVPISLHVLMTAFEMSIPIISARINQNALEVSLSLIGLCKGCGSKLDIPRNKSPRMEKGQLCSTCEAKSISIGEICTGVQRQG